MESPVVLDKPPEYHGKDDRGFPFEEEESAWSDLAARHPDIAARLRQRAPANWARKRRPSSQDANEFGESFSNFNRFPFDDIPPEFREHFPAHFNRRFGREEAPPPPPPPRSPPHSPPHQQTAATQTELDPPVQPQPLPQYGLRNTVDLGQKSAADPSLVDADERNQRSLSAPPESRTHVPKMSAQEPSAEQPAQPHKVRNIPIFVEGRDQPVINSDAGDGKPHHPPHHPHHAPPLSDNYFQEDPAAYTQPPHFSKAFGGPYKNYGKGQPFAQNVFPQTFARGASPGRAQSPRPQEEPHPKPQPHAHQPPPQAQARPQQPPPQPQARPQQPPPQPQQPPSPPPASKPAPPDPITQILAIQTDVLNLMTEVEQFTGAKKDKRYMFLDEMLTRNLIKLDNIETDGKENIRNARKEAIKCIQKCIAVLEAKAESNDAAKAGGNNAPPPEIKDSDMSAEGQAKDEEKQNGEVEIPPVEGEPAPADTRPPPDAQTQQEVDKKPKNKTKNTKKRDKSADKKADSEPKAEAMQVDHAEGAGAGAGTDTGAAKPQEMEVDSAASQ